MTVESGAGCGREVLDGLANILTPDTILPRHRAAETIRSNCFGWFRLKW